MNPECITCKHINNCQTVTPQKILEHFRCHDWEEVERPAEVEARCDIITKFGERGLEALINPEATEEG